MIISAAIIAIRCTYCGESRLRSQTRHKPVKETFVVCGYNHGYFGEKSPMGSNDCVVLVCKKASKMVPSRDLVVFTARDAALRQRAARQKKDDKRKGGLLKG